MDADITRKPTILIDLKKNRITITRKTLQAIGSPEYILLLVSPEERTLVISPGDSSDKRAHRVPPLKAEAIRKREVELYSKPLMKSILSISSGWQDSLSYKIHGDIINGENILRFPIGNADSMR
jgi:hypothetical protein